LVAVVFVFFPKNISRIWLFATMFLGDFYIWQVFKSWFFSFKKPVRNLILTLYWFPAVMLVLLMIFVAFFGYSGFVNTTSYTISGMVMIVFSAKFIFAIFLLLADFTRLMIWIFKYFALPKPISKIKQRSKVIIGFGLFISTIFIILFIWGAFDVYRFKVSKITIESSRLPKSFDGFKIVQISDIHFVSWIGSKHFEKAVNIINEQNADIVVFTGDLVTFMSSEAEEFIPQMKKIKAQYGVYAILGNHDYGDYINWKTPEDKELNMDKLYSIYNQSGWKLLRNEHVEIVNSMHDSITLIGVENWSDNKRFPSKGDLNLAMKGISDDGFRILLTHDPSHWQSLQSQNISMDLTLSGHTHAMQFAYIGEKYQFSPISLAHRYWQGLNKTFCNNRLQYLYVNTGLGTVGYLSRVGVKPEITLITLKHK
jgi:hypothetical protein